MNRKEYIRIPVANILADIMTLYDLKLLIVDEIRKIMVAFPML